MQHLIKGASSIIPSADVSSIEKFKQLVSETRDIEGIGGYKVNSAMSIHHGLPRLVEIIREFTEKPIIYDHQKWMTDIPETGMAVIKAVKDSGADAIIGYPESGPATQESYIKAAREVGLEVLVGGEMTHKSFLESDNGYISDRSPDRMYLLSAALGVTNFVVPGNKSEKVMHYFNLLRHKVNGRITFWSPGFVAQGGSISGVRLGAEVSFHYIVGRGITEAKDMHAAAVELANQLKQVL